MSKYTATIIKTGNSYALRVPIQYAIDADLVVGEKVHLALPTRPAKQDRQRIVELFRQLQQAHAFSEINDPVAWQKDIRKDRALPGRNPYGAT